MPLVIGHSQVKYLSGYLDYEYEVFSYPGYKTNQFLNEDVLFEVVPYFSDIVLVVGANDKRVAEPRTVVSRIQDLVGRIHENNPSANILLSEILPRAQNEFPGCKHSLGFLDQWNREATEVNWTLHEMAASTPWLSMIPHPEFHTLFGANRSLLSRDGLHLSFEGTQTLICNIESAVCTTPTSSTLPTATCVSAASVPSASPTVASVPSANPTVTSVSASPTTVSVPSASPTVTSLSASPTTASVPSASPTTASVPSASPTVASVPSASATVASVSFASATVTCAASVLSASATVTCVSAASVSSASATVTCVSAASVPSVKPTAACDSASSVPSVGPAFVSVFNFSNNNTPNNDKDLYVKKSIIKKLAPRAAKFS